MLSPAVPCAAVPRGASPRCALGMRAGSGARGWCRGRALPCRWLPTRLPAPPGRWERWWRHGDGRAAAGAAAGGGEDLPAEHGTGGGCGAPPWPAGQPGTGHRPRAPHQRYHPLRAQQPQVAQVAGGPGGCRARGPALPCPCPCTPRDLSLIAEAVGRSEFLRRLGEGCPEALAQSFTPVWHGPGDTVLAEGAEGTAMYIVAGESAALARAGVTRAGSRVQACWRHARACGCALGCTAPLLCLPCVPARASARPVRPPLWGTHRPGAQGARARPPAAGQSCVCMCVGVHVCACMGVHACTCTRVMPRAVSLQRGSSA